MTSTPECIRRGYLVAFILAVGKPREANQLLKPNCA
jgi:hypothetical protein